MAAPSDRVRSPTSSPTEAKAPTPEPSAYSRRFAAYGIGEVSPDGCMAVAHLHVQEKKYAEALEDLDEVLRLAPDFLGALSLRAVALSELGQDERAVTDLTRFIDAYQTKGEPYPLGMALRNRAVVRMNLGQVDEALADCDAAIAVGWYCRLERANFLRWANRFEAALVDYDRAVAESGGYSYQIHWGRALTRMALKDLPGARSDLMAAAADEPTKASPYGTLAWVELLAGDPAAAVTAATRGLELDGSQQWLRLNLAHGLLLAGQVEEAQVIYRQNRYYLLDSQQPFGEVARKDLRTLREAGFATPESEAMELELGDGQ